MERITVWTKQHRAVLEQLEQVGRYTAKREYVLKENEDCSRFVLEAYNWLVKHSPLAAQKPADADYPVWLSFSREGTYLPQPNTVMLELQVDPKQVVQVPVAKWGMILNYSYIPKDEADAKRHLRRVRERTLWFVAFCFGAVGCTAGMWLFRHKIRKPPFPWLLPLLAAVQAAALLWLYTL